MNAALFLLGLLCAQQVPHDGARTERVLVRVTTRAQQPWSGAQVHAFTIGASTSELVTGRTDSRGRAVLRLRPGRPHYFWASETLADGRHRLSRLEQATAGRPIPLVERRELQPVQKLRCTRLERWKHERPFRFTITTWFGWRRELQAVNDTVTIPAIPGKHASFSIQGRSGLRFLELAYPEFSSLDEPEPGYDDEGRRIVVAPENIACTFHVRGPKGAPIAGARLLWPDDSGGLARHLVELGTTSQRGDLDLQLCGVANDWDKRFYIHTRLRVMAPGWTDTVVGGCGGDGRGIVRFRPQGLYYEVTLRPGKTIRGRLLGRGRAIARAPVLVHAPIATRTSHVEGTWNSRAAKLVVLTDESGRFTIPSVDPNQFASLWVELPDDDRRRLAPGDAPILGRACFFAGVPDAKERTLDLGDVELGELPVLDCQAFGADGSPRPWARLCVQLNDPTAAAPEGFVLDHLGRGTLLCAERAITHLGASDGIGFGCVPVKPGVRRQSVHLGFAAPKPLVGLAVDEHGKPVSGVRLRIAFGNVGDTVEASLLLRCMGGLHFGSRGYTTTDTNGRFRFDMVDGYPHLLRAEYREGRFRPAESWEVDPTWKNRVKLRIVLDSKKSWARDG